MTDTRMRRGRYTRFRLLTGLLASLAVSASCTQPPLGPSLSNVTLDNITLQPTQGNATLCCCRVVGGITNRNTVAVHATLKFAAYEKTGDKDALGTLLYFVKDLQPNQRQTIDASGFLFACTRAAQLKTEIDVNGLVFPPD
jgi:hypothetical protein